jgi:hypothetical protein
MPLYLPPVPEPVSQCVNAALGSSAVPGALRPASWTESGGSLVAEHPLPVHVLGPEPAGGGLPGARLTGWRFLVRGSDGLVAAAETTLTPAGWVFSHFSGGPYLASTERALCQSEALGGDHQPRLLSVPGLYMVCLWLHGDTGADDSAGPLPADVLIPLAPAPPGIAAHRPYRAADLLPLLAVRLTPAPLLDRAV